MKSDLDPRADLSFTRTLAVPRNLIWECWTDPKHIPHFFVPALLLADAPGGGTTYTAIARHRTPETRKTHEEMGFFDGWGMVATQLEAYARGLMP